MSLDCSRNLPNVKPLLDEIEKKVKLLLQQLDTVRAENAVLLERNENLQNELKLQRQKLDEVLNKLAGIQRLLAQELRKLPDDPRASNPSVNQCLDSLSECMELLKNA